MKIKYFSQVITIIASIIVLGAVNSFAGKTSTANINLKKKLPTYVQKYLDNKFLNASFILSQGEEILIQGANGVSSNEGTRLTANQIMPIASNTKVMTAAAILKLRERKLLDVNDKIIKHLTEKSEIWPNGEAPSWAKELTIHNLLTHTTGIVEYFGASIFNAQMSHAEINKKIIEYACSTPLSSETGKKYKYSSTNYVLLGLIIEEVSGKSLGEFLKKEFFEPLNMKHTYLVSFDEIVKINADESTSIYPQRYYVSPNNTTHPEFAEVHMTQFIVPYADGGVVSTAHDFNKWYYGLMNNEVLSKDSVALMTKKYYQIPTVYGKKTYTGYGIFISDLTDKIKLIHSSGSIPGIRSEAGYIPSSDLYYSIISNVSVKQHGNSEKNTINLNKPQNQLDIRYFVNYILNSVTLPERKTK